MVSIISFFLSIIQTSKTNATIKTKSRKAPWAYDSLFAAVLTRKSQPAVCALFGLVYQILPGTSTRRPEIQTYVRFRSRATGLIEKMLSYSCKKAAPGRRRFLMKRNAR